MDYRQVGNPGGTGFVANSPTGYSAGDGGASFLGPGAQGARAINTAGTSANANSGGGGGGAGNGNGNAAAGGGGQAGEHFHFTYNAPLSATYAYAIGAGGAGGPATFNGGAGGSGKCIVTAYFPAVGPPGATGATGITLNGGWTATTPSGQIYLTTATNPVVIQSTLTVQGNAFSVGVTTFVVIGGDVQIGASSDQSYPLYVRAPATSATAIKVVAGLGTATSHEQFTNTGGTTYWGNDSSVGNGLQGTGYLPYNFGISGYGTQPLQLTVGGAVRETILAASGNIGIGTNSPTTKLSVYGIITSSTTQGTASVGTISATCTDQHCTLTPGAVTAVTYTFGTAWPNNIPDCVALTNAAVPLALSITAVSKTALTITSGAALTGDTVTFMCMGAP